MTTRQYTVDITFTVDTRPMAPGVLAYRVTEVSSFSGTKTWEGVCRVGDEPTPTNPVPKTTDRGRGEWIRVPLATLERVRTEGYECGSGDTYVWSTISKTPYTDIDDPSMATVWMAFNSHEIFDVNGSPLPVAQRFDDSRPGLHNVLYDLPKLMDRLTGRPDVLNLVHDRIPDYNQYRGKVSAVSFTWAPSAEQYRAAHAYNKANGWHDIQGAAITLDLLGIACCRLPTAPPLLTPEEWEVLSEDDGEDWED